MPCGQTFEIAKSFLIPGSFICGAPRLDARMEQCGEPINYHPKSPQINRNRKKKQNKKNKKKKQAEAKNEVNIVLALLLTARQGQGAETATKKWDSFFQLMADPDLCAKQSIEVYDKTMSLKTLSRVPFPDTCTCLSSSFDSPLPHQSMVLSLWSSLPTSMCWMPNISNAV
jgi:hypothetical protein